MQQQLCRYVFFNIKGALTLTVLVVGIVVAFAALQKLGSIDKASTVSMQAISGSGYPGVSSKSLCIATFLV
jgi:aspartate-semialdehyde dehydrogenase